MLKDFKAIDTVPAISGLIGKTALVSSFAYVWSQELGITSPEFIFENVRLEIIIGGIITLLFVFVFPKASPAGTLAPLIVLVPAMARFGVHPFILSIMVGVAGIISIKTKIMEKLIRISGSFTKTSLTLVIGLAGVLMSFQKLIDFFGDGYVPMILLITSLSLFYLLFFRLKIIWLIIPVAAAVSVIIPPVFGIKTDFLQPVSMPVLSPSYWWNELWGIGFGFSIFNLLKAVPFALFVILLWAMDTISITAIEDSSHNPDELYDHVDINHSFLIAFFRNMIGGIFGGAQTASLWRSFLIPLFMVKRPIPQAAVLLGVFSVAAGALGTPIRVMLFPPLVWTVLLFGIFIPFVYSGFQGFLKTENNRHRAVMPVLIALGIAVNPILTWFAGVFLDRKQR